MLAVPSLLALVPLALIAASVVYAWAMARRNGARRLASLRARWGKPTVPARDLAGVERYSAEEKSSGGATVDDCTWRDLGMDSVYAQIDRAGSFAGGARLYHRLRRPHAPLAPLRRFDEVVTTLAFDAPVREEIQSAFASMDPFGQSAILDVLFGTLMPPPRMRYLFPVLSLLTLIALVASVALPMARVALLVLAGACVAIRVHHGRRGLGSIDGLRKTSDLLDAGRKLSRVRCDALEPELGGMRRTVAKLANLGRATSWLLFDTVRANELVAIAITYVNAFLLLDLVALSFSLEILQRQRADLHALFAFAGDLDAAVAVASYRAGLQAFSRPEIVPGSSALELDAAVHPLIHGAIPNGIRVEDRGVLVTGANMSGKSTLVRTVAINALLAQAIYTTLTARYRGPVLRVRTLMSAADDVERSRSYYYAELEGAKALLERSPEGTRTLVVLDELFRGTNTDERIGASKAVLDALRRAGHFVFASTHDRELVTLLGEGFDAYHFGEDVVAGELVFPYQLRRGPSTTRNAIVLMRIVGFPEAVVTEAMGVAEGLRSLRGLTKDGDLISADLQRFDRSPEVAR